MLFKYLFCTVVLVFFIVNDLALPSRVFSRPLPILANEGDSLLELARINIKKKKYFEGINLLQKSFVIFKIQQDLKGQAQVLMELGACYYTLDNYKEAKKYFEQSLEISRRTRDMSDERNALCYLTNISQTSSDYRDTGDYIQQSLAVHTQIKDRLGKANSLNHLGVLAQNLGKYREAIKHHENALEISREIKERESEGDALNAIGSAYQSLGEPKKAMNYFLQALTIYRQLENQRGEAQSLNNLGHIFYDLEKYKEARDYTMQSLTISRQKNEDDRNEVIYLNNLGAIFYRLGQTQESINYSSKALEISRKNENRAEEAQSLNNLGNIYYALRKYPDAIKYLQRSINIQDSLRKNIGDMDKISLLQIQSKSYKLLADTLWLNQDLSGSLIAIERGRTRAFYELLSQRLKEREIYQLSTFSFDRMQLQAKNRQATIVSYSVLPDFNKIDDSKPYKLLIHIMSPSGKLFIKEVLLPNKLDIARLIDSNYTELLRSRGDQDLTIDQLKINMEVRLKNDPLSTRRQILKINYQTQLITLQGFGENPDRTDEVPFSQIANVTLPIERPGLQALYQLLIAPINELLPSNSSAPVIFIPDDVLYKVPFAALKNERGQYLIDLHTISIAPSLAILAQTEKLKRRNIPTNARSLVVGNPDFKGKYRTLPFSEDEAREVAKLLPSQLLTGKAATESAVKQFLSQARVIHFATHGVVNNDNGLDSAIILTPEKDDMPSGMLTAEKVLDLNLHADLVVLSACKTGQGKITGDGVIGLSRSFISAGAASVIVSLWSVDDKATSVLMTDFYRQWRSGKSKAQALRQAMLNTKAKYPDPYYWSSMSLYGEID